MDNITLLTKISILVTKFSNPFVYSRVLIPERYLNHSIDIALRNKIFPLFYEKCTNSSIRLPARAKTLMEEYLRRRSEQLKEMIFVTDTCNRLGIEFAFFKTIRPFTYIPDDVDIIIKRKEDLKFLTKVLQESGYRFLSKGTPEVNFIKVTNNTFVALDIHSTMASGYLTLLQSSTIWENIVWRKLENDIQVPVLSDEYEVILSAAYMAFKDFCINLATLYFITYALLNFNVERLERYAAQEGLQLPLSILLSYVAHINRLLYGKTAAIENVKLPIRNNFLTSVIKSDSSRRFKMPYPLPIPISIYTHVWKFLHENRRHNLNIICQFIKQPASKGAYSHLLRYLRFLGIGT